MHGMEELSELAAAGEAAEAGTPNDRSNGADEVGDQLARRRAACQRIPPMDCGCRDPEDWPHLAGQCRYRRRAGMIACD
jgi:hypothetical protein